MRTKTGILIIVFVVFAAVIGLLVLREQTQKSNTSTPAPESFVQTNDEFFTETQVDEDGRLTEYTSHKCTCPDLEVLEQCVDKDVETLEEIKTRDESNPNGCSTYGCGRPIKYTYCE